MRVQQVPNSPYFIHYDDEGFCCISKSRESQESIPESEMQEFLDAVVAHSCELRTMKYTGKRYCR